jgi:hypothetical protein
MIRIALGILLLALTGCASGDPATPPPASAEQTVTVTVARSGGIANVRETINVDGAGEWTRTPASDASKMGQLSLDQLNELQKLATDPRLPAEAATVAGPSKCADAFNYEVTAGAATVRFVDCDTDNFQPTAAMALVDYVQQVAVPK